MIFRLTFKTPYVTDQIPPDNKNEKDSEEAWLRFNEVTKTVNEFVKYNELITIEFDTEKGTAIVVPLKGS